MPGECFFFSSRRRHTRCSRDWSSDVCSSDLTIEGWRVELARQYAPRRVVLAIAAQTPDLPPALADKTSRAAPVAYVCRGSSCAAPVDSLEALTEQLRAGDMG